MRADFPYICEVNPSGRGEFMFNAMFPIHKGDRIFYEGKSFVVLQVKHLINPVQKRSLQCTHVMKLVLQKEKS